MVTKIGSYFFSPCFEGYKDIRKAMSLTDSHQSIIERIQRITFGFFKLFPGINRFTLYVERKLFFQNKKVEIIKSPNQTKTSSAQTPPKLIPSIIPAPQPEKPKETAAPLPAIDIIIPKPIPPTAPITSPPAKLPISSNTSLLKKISIAFCAVCVISTSIWLLQSKKVDDVALPQINDIIPDVIPLDCCLPSEAPKIIPLSPFFKSTHCLLSDSLSLINDQTKEYLNYLAYSMIACISAIFMKKTCLSKTPKGPNLLRRSRATGMGPSHRGSVQLLTMHVKRQSIDSSWEGSYNDSIEANLDSLRKMYHGGKNHLSGQTSIQLPQDIEEHDHGIEDDDHDHAHVVDDKPETSASLPLPKATAEHSISQPQKEQKGPNAVSEALRKKGEVLAIKGLKKKEKTGDIIEIEKLNELIGQIQTYKLNFEWERARKICEEGIKLASASSHHYIKVEFVERFKNIAEAFDQRIAQAGGYESEDADADAEEEA